MIAPSGKGSSLWSQIFSALWITGWSAFMFIKNPADMSFESIIATGIAIPLSFSPIFVSIIMDKIKEIKIGKAE